MLPVSCDPSVWRQVPGTTQVREGDGGEVGREGGGGGIYQDMKKKEKRRMTFRGKERREKE